MIAPIRPRVQTRNRGPKKAMLQAIGSFEEPFTTTQLSERARASKPDIARATIYRNIQIFLESGLLRQVMLPWGDRVFVTENMPVNVVVYCEQCQKVRGVKDAALPEQIGRLVEKAGFETSPALICVGLRCNHDVDQALEKSPAARRIAWKFPAE